MELEGKRIVVTGCGRGMGAATVRAYVNAGARVVGMDITDDEGRAVCEEASGGGAGAGGDPCRGCGYRCASWTIRHRDAGP